MFKLTFLWIAIKVVLFRNVLSQTNLDESPCPDVFRYDSWETGKWHGTVSVKSDITLYGVYIDLILDRAAESIGNSLGDVETINRLEYKVKNRNQILNNNQVLSVRISVNYNSYSVAPKVRTLRLNGRQICNANTNVGQQTVNQNSRTVNPYSISNRNTDQIDDTYTSSHRKDEVLPLGVNNSNNNRQDVYNLENTRVTNNYNEIVAHRSVGTETSQRPLYSRTNQNTNTVETKVLYGNTNTEINRNNDQIVYPNNLNSGLYNRYTTTTTTQRTVRRNRNRYNSEYDDADSSMTNDKNNDYFEGDFHLSSDSKIKPTPLPRRDNNPVCGQVAVQPTPLIVGGQATTEGQWPWHVALYQSQTVDSKYICGGSLITTSHVITAAHCVTRKNSLRIVNARTLTVYLGKYNLRKSSDSVQIMLVRRIFVHPQYNASSFYADLAVLKLTKPSDYTAYVRPVCLWKENEIELSHVVERDGTVVGWGFDEDGHVTEEITLVRMPVVKQTTCIWSFKEFYTHFTSEKSYCAGYENGTSVCNGDSGGGMVFPDYSDQENVPTWRLRGLVSISVAKQNEYRCDPYHFVVFTDLAQFLDWIKETLLE